MMTREMWNVDLRKPFDLNVFASDAIERREDVVRARLYDTICQLHHVAIFTVI